MSWRKKLTDPGLPGFDRFDRLSKVLELVLAVALVLVAGRWAAPLLRGLNAVMFWGGAVLLGTLFPLAAGWYANSAVGGRMPPERLATVMAVLVLVGGALLRISLLQAGQVQ
jgi:formate-dependent nitrite reductase membrane component NrfD